jgi:hypothetical protein
MRPLPETCVKLSSPEGKVLFKEALASGGMEGYFTLAENFITQAEPSYCSVSTLTMVLNAMNSLNSARYGDGLAGAANVNTGYISEPELQCKLEEVEKHGMTLSQFVSLAQQHGVRSPTPTSSQLACLPSKDSLHCNHCHAPRRPAAGGHSAQVLYADDDDREDGPGALRFRNWIHKVAAHARIKASRIQAELQAASCAPPASWKHVLHVHSKFVCFRESRSVTQ